MSEGEGSDRDSDILEKLERTMLGKRPRYTRLEVADKAGVSIDFAERLWRALGFPSPRDDEKVFNVADVRALEVLQALAKLGAVDNENVASLARALGQSYARLAEWQAELVSGLVESPDNELDAKQMLSLADDLLPLMEKMQTYVWRRHLATAAVRTLAKPLQEQPTSSQVVGFADIVGFTSMSRQMDHGELAELIEHFEATASAIIAVHHGRVVKTIGDEIMFVTDSPEAGAQLALDIASRGEGVALRPLRIGLAYGEVLSRLGDVYGPVVNMAARLTSIARPGTVVVDRALADELADQPDYKLRRIRRVKVRGYSKLEPWALRSAADD